VAAKDLVEFDGLRVFHRNHFVVELIVGQVQQKVERTLVHALVKSVGNALDEFTDDEVELILEEGGIVLTQLANELLLGFIQRVLRVGHCAEPRVFIFQSDHVRFCFDLEESSNSEETATEELVPLVLLLEQEGVSWIYVLADAAVHPAEHGHNLGDSLRGLEVVLAVHELGRVQQHLELVLSGHHLLDQQVVDDVVDLRFKHLELTDDPAERVVLVEGIRVFLAVVNRVLNSAAIEGALEKHSEQLESMLGVELVPRQLFIHEQKEFQELLHLL